jgi:hypothetical protein
VNRHPSALALEAYLLDRASAPQAAHIASCTHCQERVAKMEKEGEHFRQFVLPATLDAVVAANTRRSKKWVLWLVGPLVAATAAILVTVRPDPPPTGEQVKGSTLGLTAYMGTPGGAEVLRDGEVVRASASLRFKVNPAGTCRFWLVSVDESINISRIYPPQGEGGAQLSEAGALPGGAVLDGRPGLERFYAVCTRKPLAYADLEKAVRSAIQAAPAVKSGPPLLGLPRDARQASLLVDKR